MARRNDDDAPWLAEAGGSRAQTNVSKRSFFWTLVISLGLATVVAIGLVLLFTRKDTGSTQGYMNAEQAPLITAEPGPYKIAPADPKGLEIEGQDQTIYAAGEGIDPGSVIDTTALPEAPLPRPGTVAPAPAPGLPRDLLAENTAAAAAPSPAPATNAPLAPALVKPVTTPMPAATKPAAPPPAPAKKTGTVQLGAFSSVAAADEAWARLAARHGLSGKRVVAVEKDGKTLYRLRAIGDSAQICQKVKAAGDACAVVE
jgi:hypothetical protein